MKKIMMIVVIGLVFLMSSCEKDNSLQNAKCAETYLNELNELNDKLVKNLMSAAYYKKMTEEAKVRYDNCIK